MPNPFTSETKGEAVRLDNGLIRKLRFPPTVQARVLAWKPGHLSLGDFALKAMYDEVLIAAIKAGRYGEVTAALVADWGAPVHNGGPSAPSAATVHGRGGRAA